MAMALLAQHIAAIKHFLDDTHGDYIPGTDSIRYAVDPAFYCNSKSNGALAPAVGAFNKYS
jgi:hypothetical protein